MTTIAPRITTRISEDAQLILSKAAAMTGISSINSFVLSAALEKAKKIIEAENRLTLSLNDAEMLVNTLDESIHINKALNKAAKSYSLQNQDDL